VQDERTSLTREQIEAIIPHRAPFLLVDRIVDIEFGKRAVGIMDDPASPHHDFWVRGHFPGFAVLPGALLIEALAEVGAVAALGVPETRGKIAVLTGVDNWKFRQMALPGTSVRLEAELTHVRRNFGKGHMRALADDRLLCEGDLSFAIVDRPEGLPAPA
jgi:3-hydroxyacyl-[acyl-carrier-protein] dehydratase